jgi:hypothetical protein
VEYRPKTNTEILWKTGHAKGKSHTREVGKEYGRVNIVQILCTLECKWKNDTCVDTILGMGERAEKRRAVEG